MKMDFKKGCASFEIVNYNGFKIHKTHLINKANVAVLIKTYRNFSVEKLVKIHPVHILIRMLEQVSAELV